MKRPNKAHRRFFNMIRRCDDPEVLIKILSNLSCVYSTEWTNGHYGHIEARTNDGHYELALLRFRNTEADAIRDVIVNCLRYWRRKENVPPFPA